MPIFEYICKECDHHFEVILHDSSKAACPSCRSKRLEKQLSLFAASTKGDDVRNTELAAAPCTSCGDPRGAGSCSLN